MGLALNAYLKFLKLGGETDQSVDPGNPIKKPQNTLARPRKSELDLVCGTNSDFATVEQPYTMSEAFPWDNKSWYME
jgi:hypothetical protein